VIDHVALNWDDVVVATYRIEQSFRYVYPGPIFDLAHRLVVLPRLVHADQRRLSRSLSISPHGRTRSADDAFGNEVVTFTSARIDAGFEIAVEATVLRCRASGPHEVGAELLEHARYREGTALTAPDARLRDAASALRSRARTTRDLAEAIVDFVHREIAYAKGVTDVATTAAEAFALKRGVCQDFAHVALSIARACGLSARYVSGHLLGEGATHAWIEFILPGPGGEAIALSYDPTYGVATSLQYVVVAVGRDYADVAPTSGVYTAPYAGTLEASTHVHVREVGYA